MSVNEEHKDDQVQQGRNKDGTLAKGHKISVGNHGGRPKDSNKKEYLETMRDFMTPERWKELLEMAFKDATDTDDGWNRDKGREFFAKRVLPSKIEVEFTGEQPVQIIAVEGFTGWKTNAD